MTTPHDPPPTAAKPEPPPRTVVPAPPVPLLTGGNQVALLEGGDELFPAICSAVAAARHQVWLATYIFHDDATSQAVATALADAARRGVWVGVVPLKPENTKLP